MLHQGALISVIAAAIVALMAPAASPPAAITVDYPAEGSIFPPDFAAPTFQWRDAAASAIIWQIEIQFTGGAAPLRLKSKGEPPRIGRIDQRAVGPTNELPKLSAEEASAHTWVPDEETWSSIKRNSAERPATLTFTGYRDAKMRQLVSRGQVTIKTSKDPVAAPIFYRDVPLMPSDLEKGVIKPLAESALPLIAWRLREVGDTGSRVLMEGLPTCANCHSFSADGKTLGMDLDGPQNDKGLYALSRVAPRMAIRNQDVISWNSFQDQPSGRMRVGFMSQVSPDGRYVITTVTSRKEDLGRNYYVVNFKDYRFLQVFYATRGVLAWYDRATGTRQALPGADDPNFVQTNAVWTPDGKYLVFARAQARDSYPEGRPMAQYANDPNETQIQYNLYRIPFNEGRGGRAEPVAGASQNGMSNAFPKVSPDGRWIVFTQCRNGLLMRPDSKLYIVPAQGGQARLMRCNLPVMNSWHSFSPNGRWLVFSSKGRSPYTQMFLTHIDENGDDSPAILIENATAANRAVNIPEFVNVPPGGLAGIDVPAVEFYRLFNRAFELAEKGQFGAAIVEWNKALEINPDDAKAQNNLGVALSREGRLDEAMAHWRKALEANDAYGEVHRNLARALLSRERLDEAIVHYQRTLEFNPDDGQSHNDFGAALLRMGRLDEAMVHFEKAAAIDPRNLGAQYNQGVVFMRKERFDDAIACYRRALEIDPKDPASHNDLGVGFFRKGRFEDAIREFQTALEYDRNFAQSYSNLGNVYYTQGRMREALEQWRKSLRLAPNEAHILNQAAWVLVNHLNDPDEAVKLATRAVELSGGKVPAFLDTLAAARRAQETREMRGRSTHSPN